MSQTIQLFPINSDKTPSAAPLAEKLRPASWEQFFGLDALDKNLVSQLQQGKSVPPSMVLWGPPGCGKTSFAKLVGRSFSFPFIEFSAVLGGVKEVREIVEQARKISDPTILFMDEIHRFNKAQQDAFLPHIESGRIVLIGATTENPSFYLTSALLSRCKVLAFKGLEEPALVSVFERTQAETGLRFSAEARKLFIQQSAGDARRLINLIESAINAGLASAAQEIDLENAKSFLSNSSVLVYDRSGEEHYNVISAFIKSLRGSDPDAALYWGFRMIEAGEEPLFIIRRMIIFASEDIGNADPRALQLAVSTHEAFEKIGLPEGRIPLAQCITYLASAPKSNRSYVAMNQALAAVKSSPKAEVPVHLRNAPTKLMKEIGYGQQYQYPHDFENAYVKGAQYLPKHLIGQKFYEPSERGYEKSIKERLQILRGKDV